MHLDSYFAVQFICALPSLGRHLVVNCTGALSVGSALRISHRVARRRHVTFVGYEEFTDAGARLFTQILLIILGPFKAFPICYVEYNDRAVRISVVRSIHGLVFLLAGSVP